MAWRRGGFRRRASSFRRRRSRSDLLPLSLCQEFQVVDPTVPSELLCSDDVTDRQTQNKGTSQLFLFNNLDGGLTLTASGESDQREKLSRGLKFRGAQFDLNIANSLVYQQAVDGTGLIVARFAVVVIDLDPLTGNPLGPGSLPDLFTQREQDKGDILWREQFHIPWWITQCSVADGFPACDTNASLMGFMGFALRHQQHHRVRIRTRRNLKENQALALAVHAVHTLSSLTLSFVFDLFGFAAVKNWA